MFQQVNSHPDPIFHISLLFSSGIPLVYELDEHLNAIKHHYVASDEIVKKAIEKIANQGKAKK